MKKVITTTVFLLLSGIILAQDRKKDEAGINATVDAMIYSWNNHNYDDLENYTTKDTDWVNTVGMWWKGRKESEYAHQVYHNTMLNECVSRKDSVAIRFVTKDVAIAHLFWHFSAFPAPPDGKMVGPDDCIATLVYVKQNGKWLMEAGENVVIRKELMQYDPINQIPKN